MAARGCKSVPHHFPSQTLLHFNSRNPSTPGILKSPKSNHTIHHHPFPFYADTTYKGHLFRSLLLHRVRLRDPLTGNRCQCRRARVPYGDHPAACAQSGTLRNRARPMECKSFHVPSQSTTNNLPNFFLLIANIPSSSPHSRWAALLSHAAMQAFAASRPRLLQPYQTNQPFLSQVPAEAPPQRH